MSTPHLEQATAANGAQKLLDKGSPQKTLAIAGPEPFADCFKFYDELLKVWQCRLRKDTELPQLETQLQQRLLITPSNRLPHLRLASIYELTPDASNLLLLMFLLSVNARFSHLVHEHISPSSNSRITPKWLATLMGADSLAELSRFRQAFAIESPLVRHQMVNLEHSRHRTNPIHDGEVVLRQWVVDLLMEDTANYDTDTPFQIITPNVPWNHVVLPPELMEAAWRTADSRKTTHKVLSQAGLDDAIRWGRGSVLLLKGKPGTGKTMLVHALATRQNAPLISIDSLGRKRHDYLDEIHLAAIFREASLRGGLVFLDEFDRLLYSCNCFQHEFLKTIEHFDGVTVLCANDTRGFSEALWRRISLCIETPFPGENAREKLWKTLLPKGVTLAADINLTELAERFSLAGGHIKNIITQAMREVASQTSPGEKMTLNQTCLTHHALIQMQQAAPDTWQAALPISLPIGFEEEHLSEKARSVFANLKTAHQGGRSPLLWIRHDDPILGCSMAATLAQQLGLSVFSADFVEVAKAANGNNRNEYEENRDKQQDWHLRLTAVVLARQGLLCLMLGSGDAKGHREKQDESQDISVALKSLADHARQRGLPLVMVSHAKPPKLLRQLCDEILSPKTFPVAALQHAVLSNMQNSKGTLHESRQAVEILLNKPPHWFEGLSLAQAQTLGSRLQVLLSQGHPPNENTLGLASATKLQKSIPHLFAADWAG